MTQWRSNKEWIEVTKRNPRGRITGIGPVVMVHEAELIFDLVTFKILKNRHGSCDLDPQQAYDTLKECIEHEDTRILLLVD